MELLIEIAKAFWFILPAYGANAFPPLMKGKKPIDFGKNLGKERILGDGKTIEGTLGGLAFGLFIALVQIFVQSQLSFIKDYGFIEITFILGLCLVLGALVGDMLGSFIKRRFGIKRGDPAPLLDQLDFLLVALLLSSFLVKLEWITILILVITTPIIHYTSNAIAYLLKIKPVPY
ncbi:MAG: CDP-2,3-bis-(O-geranylgeranyl)-sn-glycerol synthase [Candidatus Aenigmatarchaeota archaeon]|nr:CDP-2,3-bis-(O-geranylgeranyl)-sn-glycerol synthase [Candidatus Aenigmarchaeota archaeon]